MSQCYARYRSYGLPLAPKDAAFVVGGSKPYQVFGFRLNEKPNHRFDVLIGTVPRIVSEHSFTVSPITPAVIDSVLTSTEFAGSGYRNIGIPGAMTLYTRGQTDLAMRLMTRAIVDARFDMGGFGQFPKGTDPLTTISYLAYEYEIDKVRKDRAEWPGAQKELALIFATERDQEFQKKRVILDQLEAALRSRPTTPGSDEAGIDALMDCKSLLRGYRVGSRGDFWQPPHFNAAYEGAILRGLRFVPALIAHLDDSRLTRGARSDGMHSAETCTVGDICRSLLCGLMDASNPDLDGKLTQRQFQAWYDGVKDVSDGDYAFSKLANADPVPNQILLHLLAARDPGRLGELLMKYEVSQVVGYEEVVRLLVQSSLGKEQKLKALETLAADSTFSRCYVGLQALRDVDAGSADKALLAAVQGLGSFVNVSGYGGDNVSNIGALVRSSSDPSIWDALAVSCERLDPRERCLTIVKAAPQPDQPSAILFAQFARKFFEDKSPITDESMVYDSEDPMGTYATPARTIGDEAVLLAADALNVSSNGLRHKEDGDWKALKAAVLKKLSSVGG